MTERVESVFKMFLENLSHIILLHRKPLLPFLFWVGTLTSVKQSDAKVLSAAKLTMSAFDSTLHS